MTRNHRNLAVALALATCTTGLFVGCSDDDDTSGSTDDTTVEATEGDSGADDGGVQLTGDAEFCEAYTQITVLMNGEPDPTALTELVTTVEENAPDAIAEPAGVMTGAVEQLLASGGEDYSALEAPEFAAAQSEVDPYVFENCEFDGTFAVTGEDFSFAGIPESVESGVVAILFANEGSEAHEIAIMRRNDGVEESFEELLALPEEEAMDKVTPVGGAFAPSTGSKALLVSELEPGDYMAICFVPTGTTIDGTTVTEGSGDPHFVHGMHQEFTVTG